MKVKLYTSNLHLLSYILDRNSFTYSDFSYGLFRNTQVLFLSFLFLTHTVTLTSIIIFVGLNIVLPVISSETTGNTYKTRILRTSRNKERYSVPLFSFGYHCRQSLSLKRLWHTRYPQYCPVNTW